MADHTALIDPPDSESPDRPSENAAVARCIRAWQRTYNKEIADLDEDDSRYHAERAGRKAYLRAMPPLAGYENIRDFIACVTYAELTEVLVHSEAAHFLDSAKVAVAAVRREPSREPKRLGRPSKTSPAEEIK